MKRTLASRIVKKRTLSFALLSLLLLVACIQTASSHNAPFPAGYNPLDFTIDATGNPGSSDPAYAYDNTAAAWLFNAYETILFFDPLWELGPYQPPPPEPQRTETFTPQIASALPTIEHFDPPQTNPKSGLPVYSTFTFPIRTGITFHTGAFNDATLGLPAYRPAGPKGNDNWPSPLRMTSTGILTPRDVEYSIERVMVQDRTAGPAWLLYEPLLAAYGAENPTNDPDWGIKIDGCIEQVDLNSDGIMDAVRFLLANTYPDMAFKQILCGTQASVVSEAWAVNEGDLYMAEVPGGWSNWAYIYNKWHNPQPSLIDDAVDYNPIPFKDGGNAPYMISYWTRTVAWALQRYPSYWQGWPCPVPGSTARLPGYLNTVTWYLTTTWATRLANLLAGARDVVAVPRNYENQVLGQVVGGEMIRCYYSISSLSGFAFFFTMDIDPASTWVGTMQPPNTFSTAGVPPNIFGKSTVTGEDEGLNVRKAFSHAWDYDYVITNAYLGEAEQPSDPIVKGLAYDDPTVPKPAYDLQKTLYYLKLAWGGVDARSGAPSKPVLPEDPAQVTTTGALWNGGMKMTCVYPTASVPYQLALEKMVPEINALGGKMPDGVTDRFQLSVGDLDLGTRFLPEMEEHKLPTFNAGWLADYADPHNFAYPFMHSEGDYGYCQVYSDPFVDKMVEQGILIPDPPAAGYEDTVVNPTYSEYKDRDGNGAVSVGDWLTVTGAKYQMYEVTSLSPLTATTNRQRIYYDLQQYYVEQCPSTMVFQPAGRVFEQAWCRGWYDNKLYKGNYWYHRWKAVTHFGDVNNDGAVDSADMSVLNAHWTQPPFPPPPGGFNPRADINGGTGAYTTVLTGPLRGIPDGRVDVLDMALVQCHWDFPMGPMHDGGGATPPPPEITTSVYPLTNTKLVGETFTINLTLSSVQSLWGYLLFLRYNTTILTVTDMTSLVHLLDPKYDHWTDYASFNDDEGYAFAYYHSPSGGGGFSTTETRPLVSITFQVDAAGTSPLDIDEDESRLVDAGARAWINPYNLKVNDGILTTPEVAVSPQITVGPPPRIGETFDVNITITNVMDLYAWQAGMTFNPSVLECLSIAEGEFLKRAGVPTLWTPGTINNAIGQIGYSACSLTGATLGVSGSGQLMSITFRVKDSGTSTLHPTDVLLLDSNLISITPVNIVNGSVQIHLQDIAILSVAPSATEAYPTWISPLSVTVVVENQGTRTETFDVTAYAGTIPIGTKTVTLDPSATTTLVYNWNLAGVAEGIYTIRAEVPPLYGEVDTADNILTDGSVTIKHPGDANGDGVLNAYDLGILGKAWGTKVGDALYDPRADFNGDGKIDTQDHQILKDHWP